MQERNKKENKFDISMEALTAKVRNSDLNTYFIFGSIILVLAIGVYAIFSPTAKNSRLANPACGKIVIASDGPSLKSLVAPSLLQARYFLVVNPLSKKVIESSSNPYFGMNSSSSADLAYFVAGKGEEAVIAGQINPKCYQIFNQFGVRGFGGYSGTVSDAVTLYRQARISGASGITMGMNRGGHPTQQVAMENNMQSQNYWTQNLASIGGNVFPAPSFSAATNVNFQRRTCPHCSWRIPSQNQGNHVFRCPNCQALINGMSPNVGPIFQNFGQTQRNAAPLKAPPITSDAKMPHSYRGVCSNCHQILSARGAGGVRQGNRGMLNPNGTAAAFRQPSANRGGGVCILK